MKHLLTEEHVEENVLDILKALDYDIIRGSNEEYLPRGSSALRSDHKDVVLIDKLRYVLRGDLCKREKFKLNGLREKPLALAGFILGVCHF